MDYLQYSIDIATEQSLVYGTHWCKIEIAKYVSYHRLGHKSYTQLY